MLFSISPCLMNIGLTPARTQTYGLKVTGHSVKKEEREKEIKKEQCWCVWGPSDLQPTHRSLCVRATACGRVLPTVPASTSGILPGKDQHRGSVCVSLCVCVTHSSFIFSLSVCHCCCILQPHAHMLLVMNVILLCSLTFI